jgi:hypothetical protein
LRLSANLSEGKKGLEVQSALGVSLPPPWLPKATALLCTIGHLETGPGVIEIIKPLVDSKATKGKMLQTWKKGQVDRNEKEIGPGLNIIGPSLCYELPHDMPFIRLHANIDSS